MSALASVQINHLRLRGDTRNKNALLASLDSQAWPGEYDPRIIFINRLQVKASWWMLARELAQQGETEYRAAVSALQASETSNAIAFASEANLIAQLVVNIARGHAPWYQQTWLAQMQLAADPIAILLHRPVLVPEVLAQLQRQQALADFFACCTEADLQTLVERLQAFLVVNPALISAAINSALNTPLTPADITASGWYLPAAQIHWVEAWLPLLLTQARPPKAQQIALQLLACFGLWRFSPQQLRAPAAWLMWLSVLVNKARAMNLPCVDINPTDNQFSAEKIFPSSSINTANPEGDIAAVSNALADINQPVAVETTQDFISSPVNSVAEINNANESVNPPSAVDYRYIHQAGFLYLINWLRDYPALMDLPAPGSPWLWFALLQRECCSAWQLPLDNSLQQLLLEIGGLAEQDVNDTFISPTDLLAARIYVQERMARFQIKNYDWLYVPARVLLEQGYVQIYLHESAVRLELRLAGLDLNPGWVSSLGRVISFHFGPYPELQQEAS